MSVVVHDHDIKIIRLELGPYATNCYIVIDGITGHSILVDAPAESEEILNALKGAGPQYIVITHNHFDHTQALNEVKSILNVPVAAYALDAGGLPCPVDLKLNDNDILSIGKLELRVIHTPGHTPGSICLYTGKYLLAGDTIFPGGPGHTDTAGDFETILKSIKTRIITLPDETPIFPGHGDSAVLANEKKAFVEFETRKHPHDLHGDVLWISN